MYGLRYIILLNFPVVLVRFGVDWDSTGVGAPADLFFYIFLVCIFLRCLYVIWKIHGTGQHYRFAMNENDDSVVLHHSKRGETIFEINDGEGIQLSGGSSRSNSSGNNDLRKRIPAVITLNSTELLKMKL